MTFEGTDKHTKQSKEKELVELKRRRKSRTKGNLQHAQQKHQEEQGTMVKKKRKIFF